MLCFAHWNSWSGGALCSWMRRVDGAPAGKVRPWAQLWSTVWMGPTSNQTLKRHTSSSRHHVSLKQAAFYNNLIYFKLIKSSVSLSGRNVCRHQASQYENFSSDWGPDLFVPGLKAPLPCSPSIMHVLFHLHNDDWCQNWIDNPEKEGGVAATCSPRSWLHFNLNESLN